ncbi:MAG TPA: hypothetical protein VES73_09790 [Lamprocystis sp. (in: g-proteobacteria)]|nr:hypothetical protein [Lamprocystis sp. (in: g-proteobacteria)]
MQPLSPYRLLPIFLELPAVRRLRGWLDYWTNQTTTFTKVAIGYLLMEFTTYTAYLATEQLPSLSATYIEWPFLFWLYVAAIGLAAIYGRRAHRRIARVSRSFAPDTPGGDRLSAFFPALRVFSDPIHYANRHPRYLVRFAYLMTGFALLVLFRVVFLIETVPPDGAHAMELMTLLTIPTFCLIVLFEEYYRGYLFQLRAMRRLNARNKVAEQAIHDAEVLRVKNKEQEDVMALVAHKFRGSLDRIIYNTDHENSPWVNREAVSTMRGLLDIFGLISSNTERLRRKLQQDHAGESTLEQVAIRSLGLALGQLLSHRGSERIQQHFLTYACNHALVPPGTRLRDWHERHLRLADRLRNEWEQSLMELLPRANLAMLCEWVSARCFPMDTQGFADAAIRFTPYGTTESFLTILLTEAFTNLFKYSTCADGAPAHAWWRVAGGIAELGFSNPTTPSAAAMVKGSGRGHDFLRLLTEKLGGTVSAAADGHEFTLRLQLPAHLFLEQGQ